MSEDRITWTNESRRLGDLIAWPRNPRQIKTDQAKRLVESFDQFGQVETIAIGPGNEVYNGHQRLNVLAQKYGKDYEVEVRVSSRALTEKEREKLTVYLHKGAAGEWDWDTLANEFEFDELIEWGFSEKELVGLDFGDETPEDPGAQIDKAEELRVKWGVELGQLWRIPSKTADGEHRIICGDCMDRAVVERVMQGEKADMIADPPYGMNLDTDWSNAVGSLGSIGAKNNTVGNKYAPVIGDDKQFDPTTLFELYVTDEMFLFGADYYAEFLPKKNEGSWLVWDKRKESQEDAIGAEFELLWTKNKHKRRMLRHDWFGFLSSSNSKEAQNRLHPTQKPTSLIEDILNQWCKNDVVIDPFLGSGTTLVACERLGRIGRGMEISPGYVAVSLQRLADMGLEPVLLE